MFENIKRGVYQVGDTKLQCRQCKNYYYLRDKWKIKRTKYCSNKCKFDAIKINDGLSRSIRYSRKMGALEFGTLEYKKRMSETTKKGMQRPEVQYKLHNSPRPPLSYAHRKAISDRLMGKMPKNLTYQNNNRLFANVKKGIYDINGRSIYFRSSWEAEYAFYLDFLKKQKEIIEWQFESDKFVFEKIKFGTRSYLPDFKITNKDGSVEYHEVKGYMDRRSKTKLSRMKKYYPKIKIVLIDSEWFKAVKNKKQLWLN